MEQLNYTSVDNIFISDHKPVCANFQVSFKAINGDEDKNTPLLQNLQNNNCKKSELLVNYIDFDLVIFFALIVNTHFLYSKLRQTTFVARLDKYAKFRLHVVLLYLINS